MAAPSRTELQDAVTALINALYTELDESHNAVAKLSYENEALKAKIKGSEAFNLWQKGRN